jgi:glycosyltransferase involved in cell wall biosynthesis
MDVFTLPSINTLEAFGLVQVEAMMCGVPVIASDLPGVKTIVQNTGMGLVCKRNDPQSLADCILTILESPEKFIKPADFISSIYSTDITVARHLELFEKALKK